MKRGFTLIELLVVIAIIGLLAGAVFTALGKSRFLARGASLAQTINSIEKAFIMKGINDGRTDWWAIDEFPTAAQWDEVIDVNQLVEDTDLNQFLPTLPSGLPSDAQDDFGNAPYDFFIAYQNYFPSATEYSDPLPSECHQENWTHTLSNFYSIQNGVTLIIRPDYDYNTEKFKETFKYLDDHYDDGDGRNCGKFRIITYPNWVAMYIYSLDFDDSFPQ